ncbi:TetR/AcrR family transcriptional regulator [Nocardioides sp. HDW12B]|uniref:TetR/AcrR family transcriptional regulator n=1 Tax=Nocardioides sp. HDW12B TaxID=2714939 RepID=UPI0014076B97|nr:TetR/AcrR family transcriptional regulator [Nocardioides sp. HDW12B]QIK67223.1 TetR/AcrR family transcriptional regulator [Nocardioides sp. HDW12B]
MATTRMSHDDRSTQLLDVAEALFTTRGYDKVSVEDIARGAGVSRPIVYQHFGSKEGLFLACAIRAREEFEASLTAAHLASDGDLATFVERGGNLLFDLLFDQPSRWALLFSGAVGESGDLAVQLSQLRFSTVGKLGLLAGEYAPGLDTEELQAFANAISGISDSFCRWSLHNPEIPRSRILGYYRDFITSAITAAQLRSAERARARIQERVVEERALAEG